MDSEDKTPVMVVGADGTLREANFIAVEDNRIVILSGPLPGVKTKFVG